MKKYLIVLSLLTLAWSRESFSQNLILNSDCELPLVSGEIPNWSEVTGSDWKQRSIDPNPQSGQYYFYPCDDCNEAELDQTIDVSKYSCAIDLGIQKFQFIGFVRSYPQSPPDESQIIIEQLKDNNLILSSYDSGNFNSTNQWAEINTNILATPNTRKIRIRLLSHRNTGTNNDGYFDNLRLIPFPANENLEISNIVSQASSCGLNNGSIIITANGGTSQFEYSIDGVNFQTSNSFNNLLAGNYLVTVLDGNNCTDAQSVEVQEADAPQITNITSNGTACGSSNGSLTVIASGGTGQLEYSIDGINFQTSNSFNNLLAGNYLVTVLDGNNCTDSQSVEVQETDAPQITNITSNGTTCGSSNGSVTVMASGGTGQLEYSIDGINFQTSNSFNNLFAGNYTIIVHDGNNCTATQNAEVQEVNAPNLTIIQFTPITCDKNNGYIKVEGQSGTPPYEYTLDGVNFQSIGEFNNLSKGVYNITLQDAAGCSDSETIEITALEPLAVTNTIVKSTTCGEENGSIQILVNGANGVLYSIDGVSFQNTGTFENLAAGSFNFVVKDGNNCMETQVAEVLPSTSPIIDTIETTITSCDKSDGNLVIFGSGGKGNLQYSIDGFDFQYAKEFTNLSSGTYSVYVSDEDGCIANIEIELEGYPPVTIASIISKSAACGEANGRFTIEVAGGTGVIETSLNNSIFKASFEYDKLEPGIYDLLISDEVGCLIDTLISINQEDCPIFIPNIFSPNDALNNLFKVYPHPSYKGNLKTLKIFDRWGDLIYLTRDFSSSNSGWDGTFKGKKLSSGVYIYVIEIEFEDGRMETLKGDITLIK